MAKIRGDETQPEIVVRKFLFSKGFRFRKNVKTLPGKPDIVLPKYKTVIFIHGCFWHKHKNCKKAQLPETRKEFWENKIGGNVARDKKNIRYLKKAGWQVIVLWQCLLGKKHPDKWQNPLIEKLS
jgi:DNA mismatch endonuclease (patch repair protein)